MSLPATIPKSKSRFGIALFHCLSSIPLRHWDILQNMLKHLTNGGGKMFLNVAAKFANDSSDTLQWLDNISDGELSADPRFNLAALNSKVDFGDEYLSSMANKALFGMWIRIQELFDSKKGKIARKKLKNNQTTESQTIYELSLSISKGLVRGKRIYHSSLKYVAHLLQCISKLVEKLSDDTEIEFSDIEYFKLKEAMTWKRRIRASCEQVVSKDSFHIFLPQLVFHWKYLLDTLLDQVPSTWKGLVPDEMETLVCGLKEAFSDHCSPLHQLIPDMRNHLGYPLPFVNKSSSEVYVKLQEISESLAPHIGYENEKEIEKAVFLGSSQGAAVKHCLVNAAFDIFESAEVQEKMEDLEELENSINENLSKIISKNAWVVNNVKLWPLMDYLVSKQLFMTNIFGTEGVHVSECKDVLAKASSIPFLLADDSNSNDGVAAVALYLFNISNCSAVYPGTWLNYDMLITENKDSPIYLAWEGEKTFVLHPMGCKLSYHLLTGFCKSDKEVGFMSVGNHAEREIQLNKIRKTLWNNWITLSEPSNQYGSQFKKSSEAFAENLISSLVKTFCSSTNTPQNSDIFALVGKFLVSCKEVIGPEGLSLLQEILAVKDSFETGDVAVYAKLGVLSGLLQSWLLSHIEPLDPAQQRTLLLSYCKQDLSEYEDSVSLLKWIQILTYSHNLNDLHPHCKYYEEAINKLKAKIASLSQKVAYRPKSSQYNEIKQEIDHFMKTLFRPSRILDLVGLLTGTAVKVNVMTALRQCEATLRSCDIFIKKLLYSYPIYRDLIVPLLYGVVTACESLRVLMVVARNKDLSSAIVTVGEKWGIKESALNLDGVLSSMMYFPHLRNLNSPDTFLTQNVNAQKFITHIIKENSNNIDHVNQCRSLELRASFYDMFNLVSSQKYFTKDCFSFMKELLEKVILWWREQETEKKRKKEEEDSLFIYKARNLAISETEEEEIQREYMELFPDYADEFKDLEYLAGDDDEDMEIGETSEEGEGDVLKLTEEYLEEVIEIHRLLISNFTETSWLVSDKSTESMPVTPVILRANQVQLFMKVNGPFGTYGVDSASMGSLVLTNHVSSSLAMKSSIVSVVKKPFNYYHDCDLEEALKLRPLLETLNGKANELLEKWPSHPSLMMIKKVVDRVLNFSVTSPMIRLVIGLEMVLEKSQEWEKNAHKGVSLSAELTPITEQVIEWRKMELKAWKSCLEMITHKVYNEANKFWLHLYESFLQVNSENVNELTQALKQFMETSLVGDYRKRLEILKAFHCQLCLEIKHCGNDCNKEILTMLVSMTWNIYKYYNQFLPSVDEALKTEKKPIEKKVRDFIKILRWNDINFFAVRESVVKSRRTLHRHMRDWEKALRQPFSPLLVDKTDEVEKGKGEWDTEKATLDITIRPVESEVNQITTDEENALINKLPALTKKSFAFTCKTIDKMPYTDNIEGVEEMTEDVLKGYNDLIVATSKAENLPVKEDRIKSMKEIVNRKKKALSILFKNLHYQGISYTKGNSIWREDDIDKCMVVPPLDIKVTLKEIPDTKITKKCLDSCDKYYYKSIGRQALLLKSLHQAHKDLHPEEVKRLRGLASHFFILLRDLRHAIPDLCSATSELDCLLNEIDKATHGYVPVPLEFCEWWKKVYSLMISLALNLEEEIELFETYPKSSSLLEILPQTHSFNELEIETILESFKNIFFELNSLITHSNKVNKSLSNDSCVKLPSTLNIEHLVEVVIKLSAFEEKLSDSIKIFDQEFRGTTSLSKPLISWIKEWKETFNNFSQWKENLMPANNEDYVSSINIETCLVKILKSIEELYKHHCQETSNNSDENSMTKDMISVGLIRSLILDYEYLRSKDVKALLMNIVEELNDGTNTSVLIALKSLKPVLQQYLTMCKNVMASMLEGFRSLSKLHSVLLGIFQEIATKGFCRSQELEGEQDEDNKEGATEFQDSGPGLSEGEGLNDVSERFESEDQLESALQEGEKEQEGNKNVQEENGVEISHDFEGALQDVEKDEDDEKEKESDDEDDNNEDLDKQMGETEKDADKLDEKLWGDEDEEEEEEDGEKKDKDEERGPGDGETTESKIVAKDNDNDNEENENQEKKKKKELEVMEEDRREEVEQEEEETYDDKYKDKLGGEDHPDENGEDEQMDLPDDLNLEGNEKDNSDDEAETDMNPEIEVKDLFPEEEKEEKEKNPEEGADEDAAEEGKDDKEEGSNATQEDNVDEEGGEKSDKNRQTTGEEMDEKEEEEDEDEKQPIPSTDIAATAEAQSADMETMEASKDKTKNEPDTATKAQPEQDEDQKQEEQGEVGEQTEDVTGVGQSDSKTKEESHVGETSALTNEENAKQKMEDQDKPRKPGDQDQTKSLGEIEKDIHHGLLTSKEKKYKEKEESDEITSDEKKDTENKPENRDAEMYEHIEKADEKFDKQTVDAGTREEAKLVPAPVEEEQEKEEEPEGIVDSLMEIEEEKDEICPKEETRKRESENEANEGADVKRRKADLNQDVEMETNEHETRIEGDAVTEMIVQRPAVNEILTQMEEEEEEIGAAIFDEDVATTRENIKEAEEGDIQKGSEQWEELEGRISSLALQLCEQLRLILEPTEAAKLRGDYRTGKRLNMRKVIPYIASQFRKDKIWLRRSQPSKRSYQVLLSVDDSQSMSEVNAGTLARESVALVAKALTLLEVGQVGVISFGEETKILHPFHKPFSDIAGGKIFGNLSFSQSKSNFAQMLEDSVALLSTARGGQSVQSDTAQLLLIVSDGQTHARSLAVKAAVRAAREARVFIVFLVLDAHDNKYSFYDHLVYEDGQCKSMVETFPFPFFIVVRDLDGLPDAIATALRQWFELVTADAH